jgi:hypothetical protein
MKSILVLALTLVVAMQAPGAVNGVVKDTQGAPVAGALVVAEGTNEAAITDAAGKFQLGPIQSGVLRSVLAPRLQESGLRVDAQGRIQRMSEPGSRKVYYRVPSVLAAGGTSSATSKRSAAADIDLLVSQGSHFGTQMPVNPASSVPVEVPLELIAEFAKLNKVEREVGDIQVLEFTDSTILGVDVASKDNPVCKDGKAVLLPDTTLMAYKIIGKTLYQWSPEDVDSDEPVAALFTSATGTKFGTWNYVGFGQAPVELPDGITQGGMDSLLALQAKALRISGTSVLGDKTIRNDVQAGFCLGPILAQALGGGMMPGTLVGVPKNCNEVALTNGTESATLSFVSTRDSVTTTFAYKGSTCVETSPASLDPAYDCEGKPDGYVPEDTSDGDLTGIGGLGECEAFTTFLLGGIDIPGFPVAPGEGPGLAGGLPALKPGASSRVSSLPGWPGVKPFKFVVLPGSGTGRKAGFRSGTWVR